MIAQLRGTVADKTEGRVVLDVNGVGYEVFVGLAASLRLPDPGGDALLHVRTVVREDSITLYGFDHVRERDLFDLLNAVNGIGPRTALAALASLDYEQLVRAIRDQDLRALTKIPGMGKKTAERVVLELRQKVEKLAVAQFVDMSVGGWPPVARDALSALENLGYSSVEAQRTLDAALKALPADAGFEAILAQSLKNLGRV